MRSRKFITNLITFPSALAGSIVFVSAQSSTKQIDLNEQINQSQYLSSKQKEYFKNQIQNLKNQTKESSNLSNYWKEILQNNNVEGLKKIEQNFKQQESIRKSLKEYFKSKQYNDFIKKKQENLVPNLEEFKLKMEQASIYLSESYDPFDFLLKYKNLPSKDLMLEISKAIETASKIYNDIVLTTKTKYNSNLEKEAEVKSFLSTSSYFEALKYHILLLAKDKFLDKQEYIQDIKNSSNEKQLEEVIKKYNLKSSIENFEKTLNDYVMKTGNQDSTITEEQKERILTFLSNEFPDLKSSQYYNQLSRAIEQYNNNNMYKAHYFPELANVILRNLLYLSTNYLTEYLSEELDRKNLDLIIEYELKYDTLSKQQKQVIENKIFENFKKIFKSNLEEQINKKLINLTQEQANNYLEKLNQTTNVNSWKKIITNAYLENASKLRPEIKIDWQATKLKSPKQIQKHLISNLIDNAPFAILKEQKNANESLDILLEQSNWAYNSFKFWHQFQIDNWYVQISNPESLFIDDKSNPLPLRKIDQNIFKALKETVANGKYQGWLKYANFINQDKKDEINKILNESQNPFQLNQNIIKVYKSIIKDLALNDYFILNQNKIEQLNIWLNKITNYVQLNILWSKLSILNNNLIPREDKNTYYQIIDNLNDSYKAKNIAFYSNIQNIPKFDNKENYLNALKSEIVSWNPYFNPILLYANSLLDSLKKLTNNQKDSYKNQIYQTWIQNPNQEGLIHKILAKAKINNLQNLTQEEQNKYIQEVESSRKRNQIPVILLDSEVKNIQNSNLNDKEKIDYINKISEFYGLNEKVITDQKNKKNEEPSDEIPSWIWSIIIALPFFTLAVILHFVYKKRTKNNKDNLSNTNK
ncbi:GA module-containing protein [Mycoplasmopsis sturni]|uniref:GA module-containing protein n=1 Tax=Mycoplasmopsis sturni TaxID=39047 RepID=UPI00056C3613|nr:GA module-containing protein [Mycoplasmopsis sturni]